MAKVTQFTVGLDNRPGTLGKLCGVLKRARVNIEAIALLMDGECGWVRFVGTPTASVKSALAKARYSFGMQRILRLEVSHRSGALRGVATRLAKAGININYVYGSNPEGGTSSTLLLSVSDLDRAAALFEDSPAVE
ncbi:MAG: hypothetical protein JXQ75_23915 [Phycisphaerae bacterium]|nr:hypothetical protein [Phycisphaerae bacterium]